MAWLRPAIRNLDSARPINPANSSRSRNFSLRTDPSWVMRKAFSPPSSAGEALSVRAGGVGAGVGSVSPAWPQAHNPAHRAAAVSSAAA